MRDHGQARVGGVATDLDSARWYDHFDARRDRRGTIRTAGMGVAAEGHFATPPAPRAGHRGIGGVAFVDVSAASEVARRPSQPM